MKNPLILLLAILAITACTTQPVKAEQRNLTFDPTVQYSREVINARMTYWKNKEKVAGFPNANSTNGATTPETAASWDYVPGVVAKGILEVWEYYKDNEWADAWYQGLCAWGRSQTAKNEGGSLDDLNCTKVFFGLYNGAKAGGKFANADNATYFMNQMKRGAAGLADHKSKYSITEGNAAGGWSHKAESDHTKSYFGQMWCDGAYMGPALLAQLIAVGATTHTSLTWDDVVLQFTTSWPYLWDTEKKLPYHVIFTDVTTNKNAKAIYEAGHAYPTTLDANIYRSEEYWGRAAGWYILAIVDVLEAMEQAGKKGDAHFQLIQSYLSQLADGLVARQDAETGCWYQLLQYDNTKCAKQGVDDTGSSKYTNVSEGGTQCNYLESSASCLITAALLKGTRLGYISHAEAGKKGYEGIIENFLTGSEGNYQLTSSCQSAGISSSRYGTWQYYLIGNDVPIQNDSEGKVLGAFLMAAVEYERAYMYPPTTGDISCNCLKVSL